MVWGDARSVSKVTLADPDQALTCTAATPGTRSNCFATPWADIDDTRPPTSKKHHGGVHGLATFRKGDGGANCRQITALISAANRHHTEMNHTA